MGLRQLASPYWRGALGRGGERGDGPLLVLMRIVGRDKLSKVNSLTNVGSQGMVPIASVLGGAILGTFGYRLAELLFPGLHSYCHCAAVQPADRRVLRVLCR